MKGIYSSMNYSYGYFYEGQMRFLYYLLLEFLKKTSSGILFSSLCEIDDLNCENMKKEVNETCF